MARHAAGGVSLAMLWVDELRLDPTYFESNAAAVGRSVTFRLYLGERSVAAPPIPVPLSDAAIGMQLVAFAAFAGQRGLQKAAAALEEEQKKGRMEVLRLRAAVSRLADALYD